MHRLLPLQRFLWTLDCVMVDGGLLASSGLDLHCSPTLLLTSPPTSGEAGARHRRRPVALHGELHELHGELSRWRWWLGLPLHFYGGSSTTVSLLWFLLQHSLPSWFSHHF